MGNYCKFRYGANQGQFIRLIYCFTSIHNSIIQFPLPALLSQNKGKWIYVRENGTLIDEFLRDCKQGRKRRLKSLLDIEVKLFCSWTGMEQSQWLKRLKTDINHFKWRFAFLIWFCWSYFFQKFEIFSS
mgnify:CR=1 FL=1